MQNGTARPISIPVTHSWSSSHSPVRYFTNTISSMNNFSEFNCKQTTSMELPTSTVKIDKVLSDQHIRLLKNAWLRCSIILSKLLRMNCHATLICLLICRVIVHRSTWGYRARTAPRAARAGGRAPTTRSAARCTAWTNVTFGAPSASGRRPARASATSACACAEPTCVTPHISKTVNRLAPTDPQKHSVQSVRDVTRLRKYITKNKMFLFNIKTEKVNTNIILLNMNCEGDIFLLFKCGSYFDCIAHVFL